MVNQKLLTEDEKDQILGNESKNIKATGKVTIGDKTIVFIERTLAKDVLKTDPTATEAKDKSPYVKYNGMNCRVLYNDETHGLQIVTADNVEHVTIGYDDPEVEVSDFEYTGEAKINDNFRKAAASYNNLVDNLNKKAKSYIDSEGIAIDARCLGGEAILAGDGKFKKEEDGPMLRDLNDWFSEYGWNDKFKRDYSYYSKSDLPAIKNLNLEFSEEKTILAYRNYNMILPTQLYLYYGYGSKEYPLTTGALCIISSSGSTSGKSIEGGIKGVFLISNDCYAMSGDGSSDFPFELSL